MKMKKCLVAGTVAMMLQSVAPAQAQQVTTKGATTGDIISYMLLGAVAAATVWYLWPAAATAEVAAGAGAGAGVAGGAAAPLVAEGAMVGGAGAGMVAAAAAVP